MPTYIHVHVLFSSSAVVDNVARSNAAIANMGTHREGEVEGDGVVAEVGGSVAVTEDTIQTAAEGDDHTDRGSLTSVEEMADMGSGEAGASGAKSSVTLEDHRGTGTIRDDGKKARSLMVDGGVT